MAEPRVHDYTVRGWGHDYMWRKAERHEDGRERGRISGWGLGIRNGDVLVLKGRSGERYRFVVEDIEYCDDPYDMWFADVVAEKARGKDPREVLADLGPKAGQPLKKLHRRMLEGLIASTLNEDVREAAKAVLAERTRKFTVDELKERDDG